MLLSTRFSFTRLLAGGVLALLGACATPYYVLVKPAAGDNRWQDGMEVVSSRQDSVDVRLGVVSTSGQWLEFDVTVQNHSARPVLVAPETFYLDAYGAPAGPAVAPGPLRVQADNPEQALQQMRQQADYHQQQSANVPTNELLSSLSNIVDDISSAKRKETEAQRNARQANHHAEMARYEQERTSQAVKAVSARDAVRGLEETLLRKTTLDPGGVLRGRLRFRRYTDLATRLRVVTPVAGRELAAEFTQQRFRMGSGQTASFRVLSETTSPAPAPGQR